jgi:hypothetical protein
MYQIFKDQTRFGVSLQKSTTYVSTQGQEDNCHPVELGTNVVHRS